MKSVFLAVFFSIFSISAFADQPLSLIAKTLNSPVKEHFAKFYFEVPNGTSPAIVWYQFQNPQPISKISIDDSEHQISFQTLSTGYEVDVPASNLPPGDFVLKLRVKLNKSLVAQAKQIISGSDQQDQLRAPLSFKIDPSLEVPDPGPAGLATLAGVDSDADGVRDDIQRWINENYNASAKQRSGAKQLAKDLQSELLNIGNKEISIQITRQSIQSMDCLEYVLGDRRAESRLRQQLQAMMYNTKARVLAQIQSSANFKGQSVAIERGRDRKSACLFDPDSLPN